MHGLLGLVWLSPQEPNIFDEVFGRYATYTLNRDNQLEIATWMVGVFLLALLWRGLSRRKFSLGMLGPEPKTVLERLGLDETVRKPAFVKWANKAVTGVLLVIALLASVNYFVGTRNDGIYLHRWDAYHTVIGVKYHKELGYFDLYKCSYAIDKEGPRHFRSVTHIRDLRTRKHVPADQHIAGNDCKQRFTPERLEEFRHDLDEFGKWSSKRNWKTLMKDKGFNGTPFYATVCKLLISTVEVTLEGLRKIAYIDPVLMITAFVVVGWAFGARTAALAAIFYCVFFPNRYVHMGGSILRFDYAAALLIGFAALKKDKWGLAGAMFAWATMVRVFPAIFAVGVGIKIASDALAKRKFAPRPKNKSLFAWLIELFELRPEHLRFFAWFGGLIALFFVISLIGMDGGFDNWRLWYENMKIHNERSASFRVGFKHLFMFDGKLTGNDYALKQANFEAREDYYRLAVALLFAPLLFAVRRLDTVSFAALFGVLAFFVLTFATRYYYGIVALLFLIDRPLLSNRFMLIMGALLFSATCFDYIYFAINDSDSLMYNIIVTLELTALFGLFASWLLTNPSLLDLDELDPRLPTHVPAAIGARVEPVVIASERSRESEIETLVSKAGDASEEPGENSSDGGPASLERGLDDEQAPPDYAADAVTVSDTHQPDPGAVTLADGVPIDPDAITVSDTGKSEPPKDD